jgi:hypothetical protein
MTEIILAFAALWAVPFAVAAPALLHCDDLTWLERELERRLAEAEEVDAASNDNEWRPT